MRAYRYVFYRLYRWASAWEWDDAPQYNALFIMIILAYSNIVALAPLFGRILGRTILLDITSVNTLVAMVVLGVPQYFLLIHRQRYKKIEEAFQTESLRLRRIRGILVSLFVIGSIIAAVCVALRSIR